MLPPEYVLSNIKHILGDSGVIGVDRRGDVLCDTAYSTDAGVKTWLYYFVHGDKVILLDSKIEGDGPELLDPSAISPSGVIVGETLPGDHSQSKAYVELDGKAFDLNKLIDQPNWVLMGATEISSDGKIAGVGEYNGHVSGYLLVPE